MPRKTDPDRIFAEDPATIQLKHKSEVLMARLCALVGSQLSAASMPVEAPPGWTQETVEVHAKYVAISAELARLNSRRNSQQLSRFLDVTGRDQAMSAATRRWRYDRY